MSLGAMHLRDRLCTNRTKWMGNCLTPRPEENCDAISDTKHYTVRRFTIAAYGTMDNIVHVRG